MILESVRDVPAGEDVAGALDRTTTLLDADIREIRSILTSGEATEWLGDDLQTALPAWTSVLPEPERITHSLPAMPLLLDEATVALAFRVTKEAVRNAVKHASAEHIAIVVDADPAWIHVVVTDDGVGFATAPASGVGLRLIRQVARASGGRVTIGTHHTGGCRIEVQLPRQA